MNRRALLFAALLAAFCITILAILPAAPPEPGFAPITYDRTTPHMIRNVRPALAKRIFKAMDATNPTCLAQGKATSGWAEVNAAGQIEIITSCEGLIPPKTKEAR